MQIILIIFWAFTWAVSSQDFIIRKDIKSIDRWRIWKWAMSKKLEQTINHIG